MLRDLDEDGGPGCRHNPIDREVRLNDNLAPLDLDKSPDEKEAGEGCGQQVVDFENRAVTNRGDGSLPTVLPACCIWKIAADPVE